MAQLQWRNGTKSNIIYEAKSVNGMYRISFDRHAYKTPQSNARYQVSWSSSNLVSDMHKELYVDTDYAKAACQAAEDKICDVWPKYYETYAPSKVAFIKFDNASELGLEVKKDSTATTTAFVSYNGAKSDRRELSEEEAMSRLDKTISDHNKAYKQAVKDMFKLLEPAKEWM